MKSILHYFTLLTMRTSPLIVIIEVHENGCVLIQEEMLVIGVDGHSGIEYSGEHSA
jgi:hypothetical protein